MLVMRNFGYLGLHSVVDSKSSLARDRLVDFSGELQVRRRDEDEGTDEVKTELEQVDGYKLVLPDWHHQYVAEPTLNGGRYSEHTSSDGPKFSSAKSYAQELLPIPLQTSPPSRLSAGMTNLRGQLGQEDIEPFYHSSFCNELIAQPRILFGYSKGNVVLKVELREIEWNEDIKKYLAHLPSCGPSIHNTRRGPFLVQSSFTSCTSRRSHQFLDDFKLKLPLDLNPRKANGKPRNVCLLFTLFRIKLGNKGRWKRGAMKLFGSCPTNEAEEHGISGNTRLEQVACGFLPLCDHSCLVENGLHDIRIAYKSSLISDDMHSKGLGPPTTIVLSEILDDGKAVSTSQGKEDSCAEDTISETSILSDKLGAVDSNGMGHETTSDVSTQNEDSLFRLRVARASVNEPISLSVSVRSFRNILLHHNMIH
jgi:hypothetical protein